MQKSLSTVSFQNTMRCRQCSDYPSCVWWAFDARDSYFRGGHGNSQALTSAFHSAVRRFLLRQTYALPLLGWRHSSHIGKEQNNDTGLEICSNNRRRMFTSFSASGLFKLILHMVYELADKVQATRIIIFRASSARSRFSLRKICRHRAKNVWRA